MNVKTDEERKSMRVKFRLNDKEYATLKRYTEESGLRSMSRYIYYSVIATPIIHISDEELAPNKQRLAEISDKINLIAVRVNQMGKFYPEDLQEIKQGISEIQDRLAEYQAKLERLAVTPKTFRALADKISKDVETMLS